MSKKLISVALSALMLLSSFAGVYACASASPMQINTSFDENLKFLQSLNAVDDDFINANMYVTRGKFIEYVIRLMDIDVHDSGASFADVYPSHSQYPYICAAEQYGLVVGGGDGYMRPDDTITKWEATVIGIRALRYDEIIRLGLSVEMATSQTDIANGVEGNLLNAENAFIMLKNLSNENIMEQSVFGSEQVEFKKSEKTFLEHYRNIKRLEGIVTSSETTSITNTDSAGDNCIMCDGIRFNTIKTPYAQNLLGYYAEIYYHDNSKRDVIYASAVPSENKELIVDAEDIIGFSNYELKYYLDDKEKSAKIGIDTDVLYNFAPCIPYKAEDFNITQGQLRFISNDGDNEYDCVFIDEFETCIVGEVSSMGIITCKFTGDILNFDDGMTKYFFVDYRGNAFDEESLKAWDVLCIYKSNDGKKQRIVKCDAEIGGEVSEISGNDVYIDGNIYKLSESFAQSGQTVSVGGSYVFYLDVRGQIAAYNDDFYSDGFSFGYLIGIDMSSGLDSKLSLKLLDQNGEIRILEFAKSVVVDSKHYNDTSLLYASLGGDSFTSQPVRYKLSGGKVSRIDTASPGYGGYDDSFHMFYSGYEFTDDNGNPNTVAKKVKKLRYKATPKIFGAKVSLADDAKVVVVASDIAKVSEDDAYRMVGVSYFTDDEDYYIEAYKTIPEAHDADYLILYKDDSDKNGLTNAETNISVIDKVSHAIDDNGEETYRLSYYTRGKYYSAYADDPSVIEHIKIDGANYLLKKGDLVRLETNDDGKVSVCLFVYSPSKDYLNISNPSSADVNAKPRFQMAYVYEKYGSNIWITRDELQKGESYSYTINDLESKNASKYAIMVYDLKKDYLTIGNVSDIIGYTNTSGMMWSKVFVADRYGNPNTLVIYK